MKICDLLKNVDIELVYGDEATELDTFERDSRKVKNGDCYVAIVGDNFDGNNFIVSAIENGAKSIICSRDLYDNEMNIVIKNNINVLKVENTVEAIQNIAKPTLAVVTNIGTAHIGILGSRENILKAKWKF